MIRLSTAFGTHIDRYPLPCIEGRPTLPEMDLFRLNWFLGVLAVEFWASAVLVSFGPEIWSHYRRRLAWRRVMRARSEQVSTPRRLVDLKMRVGSA